MDPRQWDSDGATEAEKALLRAGREDGPRRGADLAILAALAAPPPSVIKSSSLARFAKVGMVAAAVAGSGLLIHRLARAPHAPTVAISRVLEARPALLVEAPVPSLDQEELPSVPETSVPRHRVAPPSRISAGVDHSLGEETKALDLARHALEGNDPARTLRLLDDYRRRFPRGRLRPESMVLRVAALVKAGQEQAAQSLAHRLLSDGAYQPYWARIQSLLQAEER
jgi:hypothetical protein